MGVNYWFEGEYDVLSVTHDHHVLYHDNVSLTRITPAPKKALEVDYSPVTVVISRFVVFRIMIMVEKASQVCK